MLIISGSISLLIYHLHNIHYLKHLLSFYYCLLIFKSFRIYRLARYMSTLRLLYKSIVLSLHELSSLIIFGRLKKKRQKSIFPIRSFVS